MTVEIQPEGGAIALALSAASDGSPRTLAQHSVLDENSDSICQGMPVDHWQHTSVSTTLCGLLAMAPQGCDSPPKRCLHLYL